MTERRNHGSSKRREAMDDAGFYLGVTLMFLPVVAAITSISAVVLRLATPVAAVVATVIVILQLRGVERFGYGPRRWWTPLADAAYLPFRVVTEIVGLAAPVPILGRTVMLIGATAVFWWPAVVVVVSDRLLQQALAVFTRAA